MDLFSPTETERLIQLIEENSPKTTDYLKELIENHQANIPKIVEGVNYYFNKGKITERVIEIYDESGNKTTDTDATNNKIPSGWHKLLVDQKVSYLAGEPITIYSKSDKDIAPVQETLGEDFEDILPELIKNASNKGRDWLHPYIDEEGNFDYIIIPSEEFIPIYDDNKRKHLRLGIRFYPIDEEVTKIEVWDSQRVTYYEMIDGEVYIDATEEINPDSHFRYGNNGYGWEKVPFIEFKNNEEAVSDITFYKQLIDAYDFLVSDVQNTLTDIQSLIYVLKGYEGTDLSEFVTNLKRYKAIAVSDESGSGVNTLKAEVPVEAVKSQLDRIAQDIYAFGQGVNSSPDKFGNAPSGVAIKNLYSLLDMKASILERKFSKGLEKFLWFVCEYLSISGQGDFDYKDIAFTFNKTLLVNELELITMAQQSMGVISHKTIIENHPWVKDAQKEREQLEKEGDEYSKYLPSVDDKRKGNASGGGGGNEPSSGEQTCTECGGDGTVPSEKTGNPIECPECGGDGVIRR